MKSIRILTAVLALAFVAGCKTVNIENGQVPSKYLAKAKKLEGVYKGEFNGVAGELVLSFEGNKPVVTYRNSHGTDILNNNCRSSFGNLLKVTVKNESKDPRVSDALFDFTPGDCSLMIYGRDASLSFKETDRGMRVSVSILKKIYQRQVCTINGGNPPHVPPHEVCHWEQEPVYLYGRFFR